VSDPLEILFEDAHCLATCKPGGELTQPKGGVSAPEDPSHEDRVRAYLEAQSLGPVYLGTVHRLDRPVSGVLLWAKTAKAARRLAGEFAARRAQKEYWAVLHASPALMLPGEGLWDDWLTPPDASGLAHVHPTQVSGSRRALTRYQFWKALQPSESEERVHWVRLWPETGRTHQLRAQTSARGVPILGDLTYGGAGTSQFPRGIALHARSLRINHPILGTTLDLVAPLPDVWRVQGLCPPPEIPAPKWNHPT